MKKTALILLSAAMLFSLTGCEKEPELDGAAAGKAINSYINTVKEGFTGFEFKLGSGMTEIPADVDGYKNLASVDFSGSSEEYFGIIEDFDAEHPAVFVEYTVPVGEHVISNHTTALELSDGSWDIDALCSFADRLDELMLIEAGTVSPETAAKLKAAYPAAEISYGIEFEGQVYGPDTTVLDISGISPQKAKEAAAVIAQLPALESINSVKPGGNSDWTPDELEIIRAAAPEGVKINAAFELLGREVDASTECLEFFREPLGDGAVDVLRKALNYLPNLSRLLLDDCDIEYALLDELRSEFPDAGIVWRVRFGPDSVLTDTEKVWTIYLTDENCFVLNYCHDVLYVDVGHTIPLTDISWTANMPKLQVLIIARTSVSDLTPLLNCPDLEYLEIFSSAVTDVSILANFKNLQHVNISNLPEVTDITALYDMTWLKRIMIVLDYVPEEQEIEIGNRIPGCIVIRDAVNPTDNGWRRDRQNNYVERYALLREQIGYSHYESPKDLIPWNYVWDMGWGKESIFTRS